MKNPHFGVASMATLASCLLASAAVAQTTVNYDLVSSFDPVGNATASASGVIEDKAAFASAVAGTIDSNNGGVFDFPTTFTANSTTFVGNSMAGTSGIPKKVRMVFSRGLQQVTNSTYTVSSNTRGVTTNATAGNFSVSFGPVTNNETSEAMPEFNVTQVGFVVLSRSTDAVYPLDIRATMRLQNGAQQVLRATLSNVRGNNVFYGFTAPPNSAIASIAFDAMTTGTETVITTGRIGLDDIGVIISNTGVLTAGPVLTQITPENSYVLPGAVFNFGAASVSAINPGDATLSLNGIEANGKLSFAGDPTNRTISIGNLDPDIDYTAVVNLTNAAGVALPKTYHFTTKEPAPSFVDVSTNGSLLYGGAMFDFGVKSSGLSTIDLPQINLAINGVNANGQLTMTGGTSTNRVCTISGLTANKVHQAVVTATSTFGRANTKTYYFHTLDSPPPLANVHGFSDNTSYPLGDLSPITDGFARWAPDVSATIKAQIVDSGQPQYGKVYRRLQSGGTRVDYFNIPPLANGVLKIAFDLRVSESNRRTIDICAQPDGAGLFAGFLQIGQIPGKITYFDNTNYIPIENFDLDTNWHHYELLQRINGSNQRTFDLKIDGVVVGTNLPWRNSFSTPLTRVRFQSQAYTLGSGETYGYADVDNLVISALPHKPVILDIPATSTQLGQGVTYKHYQYDYLFAGSKQNVFITDVNLNDPSVGIKFPYSGATRRTVPVHASNVASAVAAVNGQFYISSGSIQHLKVDGTLVNPTTDAQDQQAITDDGLGTAGSIKIATKPTDGWATLNTANIMASGPHLFTNAIKWNAAEATDTDFTHVRHPRTAAAWTFDNHLLLFVVDGRSTISEGMTIPELQDYITSMCWVRNAVNYDGGGSSTMWTNGAVVNAPSDGSPRAVTNAIAITAAPVAIPGTPTGIVAVQGSGNFALQWQLSSGSTTYEIRRSNNPGGPFELVGTSETPTFTDESIASGSTYYYVIIAKNTAGSSLASAPITVTASGSAIIVPSVSITNQATTIDITFDTQVGHSYLLQHSTTLKPGEWSPVGTAQPGTGSPMTFSPEKAPGNAFYRILIE